MDEALVGEFAAITGASPLVAEHYLSACNNDLNRAIEFFFEHPPAPNQSGPGAQHGGGGAAAAYDDDHGIADEGFGGPTGRGVGTGPAADEDEELQRALAASMTDEEPGAAPSSRQGPSAARPGPSARRPPRDVEVLDDEDEDLEGADGMLSDMARLREASLAAEREAETYMEESLARSGLLGGAGLPGRPPGTVNPPPGYPGLLPPGMPSLFPGMPGMAGMGLFPPGMLPPGVPAGLFGALAGPSGRGAPELGRGRSGSDGSEPGSQAQRRRVDARRGATGLGASASGAGAGADAAAGAAPEARGQGAWADDHEALGMSRAELEEARMMEAALLGIPYEGPLPGLARGGGGAGGRGGSADRELAPEVLEGRELRWDQDRAYEESLAADRAKEQAAARAKAEAEARERAQREAEEAAALAAALEASRVAALVAEKAARLPAEPPASAADAINAMVRLPDGSRHSRRFAASDRLSSLFDFVDVELDSSAKEAAGAAAGSAAAAGGDCGAAAAAGAGGGAPQAALKPGSYNLVAQFPRRVFSESESGGRTFAEAGLAGGGGAAFFVEQTSG